MVQMRDVELLARRMRQQLVVLLQDLVEALVAVKCMLALQSMHSCLLIVEGMWLVEP